MANGYDIARNDLSRAFLFEDGMNICCPKPHYFPCLGVDSLSQDFGDITRIECPDPFNYGKFIEVAQVAGEIGRMTTTLTTRLSRTELSLFRNMAVKGCSFDLHLHFGLCTKPTDFNQWDKMMIFEGVYVTSYGTDPLVALTSADRDSIMETIDITIGNYYEVVLQDYVERSQALTATLMPVVDAAMFDVQNCGAYCTGSSDGCSDAVAITSDGQVIYTQDGGKTWTLTPNDWSAGDSHAGISYLNGYVWSATNDTLLFAYETKQNVIANSVPRTQASAAIAGTVFVDQEVGQSLGIVVGNAGFIGTVVSPDCGFDTQTTGVYTTERLNKVQFTPGTDRALIVGENGAVVYFDGDDFKTIDTTGTLIAGLSLTAALPISDTKWIVGDSLGNMYCTDDCDLGWTLIKTPITNQAPVYDIQMMSTHVGLVSVGTKILHTFDGFCTFSEGPTCSKKNLPSATGNILDIMPCPYDLNRSIFVGQDGGQGYVLESHPR